MKRGAEGQIEIVFGIPGVGKTERLLTAYRSALLAPLDPTVSESAVWLVPSPLAARTVRDRLRIGAVDHPLTGGRIVTFDRLAELLLRDSDRSVQPLSDAARRNLLRGLISEQVRDGNLSHFQAIAETTGFLNRVVDFIAEMKRSEMWPEQFLEVTGSVSSAVKQRDRELGSLYLAYQSELHRLNRYDREGLVWAAKEQLISQEGTSEQSAQTGLLVVDGFTDFSRTQLEMLRRLAELSDRTLVSLPWDPAVSRPALFAKPLLTLRELESWNADGLTVVPHVVETLEKTGRETPSSSARSRRELAQRLFADTKPPAESITPHVQIWAVTGRGGEIDQTVQEIRRLITPDQTGSPPAVDAGTIVVAIRGLSRHADELRDRFERAAIPYSLELPGPLLREPLIKSILGLLQVEVEDWSAGRLLSVIDDNHFIPEGELWEDDAGENSAAIDVARFLRSRKLSEGRLDIRAAAHAVLNRGAEANDHRAGRCLLELAEFLEPLRNRRTFADWEGVLKRLLDSTGYRIVAETDDQLINFENRVLERFFAVIEEAAEAERLREREQRELSLSELFGRLLELCREPGPSPKHSAGGVRIVDAEDVRHLEMDVLFLIGLDETSFPQPGVARFYDDQERDELRAAGLHFLERTDRIAGEMLLFYRTVTRPRTALYLIYTEIGPTGEPGYASPYMSAVREVYGEDRLPIKRCGRLDPMPDRERLGSFADLRIETVRLAGEGDLRPLRAMFDSDRFSGVAGNLVATLEANANRFQRRGFGPHDGLLVTPRLRGKLRERFPQNYQFSVSQLENYAGCGFRFFAENVLKAERPDPIEFRTDPRRRGTLVHRILAELHRTPEAEIGERFDALLAEITSELPTSSDLQRVLRQIEAEIVRDWGQRYAEQWETYTRTAEGWDNPPEPSLLEVGFGEVPDEPEAHDTNFPGLEIGDRSRRVKLRGRIDRIDVGSVDGERRFNVIDYKTGMTLPTFRDEDLLAGRSLQLAVYALAVQRLGLAGSTDAKPFQVAYWGIREKGFVAGLKSRGRKKIQPLTEEQLDTFAVGLETVVPELVSRLRAGKFFVHNENRKCTERCEYRSVCRVGQLRPLAEPLAKIPPPIVPAENGDESATASESSPS